MPFVHRIARLVPVGAVITLVLFAYAFFGSLGTMEFRRIRWDQTFGRPGEGYYASLAEGFLRGRLSMAHQPDPLLMAMPYPFDFAARQDRVPYLWDASYLNGKYYLYFTPLPSLIFHIPYRLVSGGYPSDQLAGMVFAAWAFLLSIAFLKRALDLANRPRHVPLSIWIVMLGLANVVPFIMSYCRTYEIATLCGAAMIATWAYALVRFIESPTINRLVWTSIWLGLSIAARPNLAVIVPVLITAIVMVKTRREVTKALIMAMAPLAIIGAALALYNYARFHDPFEFGQTYQLTYIPMSEHRVCGLRNVPELLRVINSALLYVFSPPVISSEFPFADLPRGGLDPTVSFADLSDQVAGVAALAPLTVIGTLFAIVLALRKDENDTALRAGLLVLAAGWLTLFGLSTCWWVSARYEVNFWFLISAGGIVCLEAGLNFLASAGVSVLPLRIAAIVIALCSSLAGFLLGFRGTLGEFATANPELIRGLSDLFR